jgi:hypothetical protein
MESWPQAWTIRAPVPARGVLVRVDHRAHPVHLAREVAVMRAVRGAGGDKVASVKREGTDRGDDDAAARGEAVHESRVMAVAHQRRDRSTPLRQVGLHGLELLPVPPTDREADPGLGAAPGEVMGGAPARGAGPAPKDDVEVAVPH